MTAILVRLPPLPALEYRKWEGFDLSLYPLINPGCFFRSRRKVLLQPRDDALEYLAVRGGKSVN
jgi:hypothetical protein